MILGFMTKYPWGEKTNFVEKILACILPSDFPPKKHTIRAGKRWKKGDFIHMATGVRTKVYNQFNKNKPGLHVVTSVQRIDIVFRSPQCCMIFIDKKLKYCKNGEREFEGLWFLDFIKNDGLDNPEIFWKWFQEPLRDGQLIHWTDLKY